MFDFLTDTKTYVSGVAFYGTKEHVRLLKSNLH